MKPVGAGGRGTSPGGRCGAPVPRNRGDPTGVGNRSRGDPTVLPMRPLRAGAPGPRERARCYVVISLQIKGLSVDSGI